MHNVSDSGIITSKKMKTDKISESGIIGMDGRLHIPMDRLNACFREHKGERVVVQFFFAVPGSSKLQQSYYYQYIVPTIQQALRETGVRTNENAVDKFLMSRYPGDKREPDINFGEDVMEARYLNRDQMSDFLDWLKQFAAENLNVYIEDSKTL